jgi:hypothetical protein
VIDEVEMLEGPISTVFIGFVPLSSTRALGVSDELVAEDSDRHVREVSSFSLNEDAFVEGSSDIFVVIVGEVA